MRPYILSVAHKDDIVLYKKIRGAIQKLPDKIEFGEDENKKQIVLSCHILARAVAKLFPVKLQDGYFLYHWQHSWVIGPKRNIIDVYPVAILGGPIMVSGDFGSPCNMLYQPIPTKVAYGNRFNRPSFQRAVRITVQHLKKVAQTD